MTEAAATASGREPNGNRLAPAPRLFALARFAAGVDFADPSATVLLVYLVSTLASGAYGAVLALREGRFGPTGVRGGLPVEVRQPVSVRGGPPPARNNHRFAAAIEPVSARPA